MYNHQQASHLRKEFWITFGRYMSPVPSAEGVKVNWINYRTSLKDVYFRMEVDQQIARISISLEQPDAGIRELYFDQFKELKAMLHATVREEWEWLPYADLAGNKFISRIYKELPNVSVYNTSQWPELISFFKPRIIALDRFWEDAKYSFDMLR